MNKQELNKILEQHAIWLETEGKEGKRAVLKGADFYGQTFKKTDLRRADLRDVNFSTANLVEVNFIGADLRGADFCGAYFFKDSYLGQTLMDGANFSHINMMNYPSATINLYGVIAQPEHLNKVMKELGRIE